MGEIARVKTILSGFAGAPGVSTNFFRKRTGLDWSTYGADMVARVQAAWADLGAVIPDLMTITTEGSIDILDDTTGEILQTLSASNGSATGIGPSAYGPLASGLVVTWQTAGVVAGKHVRGRTFIIPVVSNIVEADGSPTAAALALATTFSNTMKGTGGEAVVPAIWSRPKKVPNSDPVEYVRFGSQHDVTGALVRDKFGILRSRRD